MKNNYPVAIIDVGSNSVRLMVKGCGVKNKYLITTRLADGKVNNILAESSVLRTLNAVEVFFDKAIKSGCNSVFIFATAAVRNAENGSYFTELVKQKTGLTVDVISGELEAELALLGALNGGDGGVIDIGGASTEVAVKENGQLNYLISHNVGAVSLHNSVDRDKEKIAEFLSQLIKGVRRKFSCDFTCVGGTVTTLATIALGIKEYNGDMVSGYTLNFKEVESIANTLINLSPKEIFDRYPTARSRADIIAGGAFILLSVMKAYGIEKVRCSDSDNLEGYLEYLTLNEKA